MLNFPEPERSAGKQEQVCGNGEAELARKHRDEQEEVRRVDQIVAHAYLISSRNRGFEAHKGK